MALQEKEFVVKNGLDIKNSTLKLNGVLPTTNQFPVRASSGVLAWNEIKSGQGIAITQSDSQILIATSGTVPGDVVTIGDLTIGAISTWTSSGSSVSVTRAAHGLIAGNSIYLIWFGTNRPSDGYYTLAASTLDTFTLNVSVAANGTSQACTIGGNIVARRSIFSGQDLSVTRDMVIGGNSTLTNNITINGTPNILSGTTSSSVTLFNTTTGNISFANSSNVISIGSASSNTTFGGSITHKGVNLQTGVQSAQKVDTTFPYNTASLTLTTTWSDVGITGNSPLITGIYSFTVKPANSTEWYFGMLPWYSGNGTGSVSDEFSEINLTKIGDGSTGSSIFIRILRVSGSAPKLQMASTSTLTNQVYSFIFRKLME